MDLPPDVLAPFGSLPTEVAACTRCVLASTRTQTVFGEGLPTARLVFCGEAPGFEEDRSGRPFVGRAGELLTDMIEKGLRLRREEVFVLNAIKCRPPENRTPLPDEIASCRPFLERQLATIRPQVIVALGNPACRALLGPVPGIMSIRGKVFEGFGAKIVPTFHPAYLLRNPDAKREVWTDLKLVLRLLGGSPSGAATNAPS
jgi:DNA polymerase